MNKPQHLTPNLLVFDWDGTLLNSTQAIVAALQKTAEEFAVPVPDQTSANYVVGMGFQQALQASVPSLPEQDYHRFIEQYRRHYWNLQQHPVLFTGVPMMLQNLINHGYVLAIATGTSCASLNRALTANRVTKFFQATRCAEESIAKPDPAMLYELMEEIGAPPESTLMIGDTTHDLQMANNAGVKAIAVTYGAHSIEQLSAHRPYRLVHSIEDLYQQLITKD